jgi:hypothetical protein
MDRADLRLVVRRKLAAGELPHDLPRVWGCDGTGEECDVCGELITTSQTLFEGISATDKRGVQLHVECLYVWDMERDAPGRT